MAERVVELPVGVVWNPNAPDAVLVVHDLGSTVLSLRPRGDDPDQRWVVLRWPQSRAAVMEPPNDEAISGHRLYQHGLKGILWAAEVLDSQWIARLEEQNRVHPYHSPGLFSDLRHFLIQTKARVVEVVAPSLEVLRLEGASAVHAAVSSTQQ
jgi:hypothetical protein